MPIDPHKQLRDLGAFVPLVKPDPQTRIWRYMDFYKFMSLIRKSALFFPQISRLEDQHEGTWQHVIDEQIEAAQERGIEPSPEWKAFLEVSPAFGEMLAKYRDRCVTTCWYMSNGQNAGMWKLYSASGYGIAIQSTIERLDRALNIPDEAVMVESKVFYSGKEMRMVTSDPYQLLFLKRSAFSHEREYRVILDNILTQADIEMGGKYIPVDVSTLVETIYVDPNAPTWIYKLVEDIAVEAYGFEAEQVKQSNLARKPSV